MTKDTKPRHILNLTNEEKKQFLDSFDIILSDCDGVMWLVVGPIEGCGKGVTLLKKAGKQVKFISNNSHRSDDEYIKKFKEIGVENVLPNDIVQPGKTILSYLKKNPKYKTLFSISSREIEALLRENGYDVIEIPSNECYNMKTFTDAVVPKTSVDAVVMDIDLNMDVAKISAAQQYLLDPNCDFIVGATDRLLPLRKNVKVIGPELFIKSLSELTGKTPLILGKPGNDLGIYLKELYEIKKPSRALFVGDALPQDIHFGISQGFQTLFVLSGATTMEAMLACPMEKRPDFYADSMADFIQFFEEIK